MYGFTEAQAHTADRLTPGWEEHMLDDQMVSEADYWGSDWNGTDWEEHFAFLAHETFAEFHPEDRL